MKDHKIRICTLFIIGLLAAASAYAQNVDNQSGKTKYQKIEISKFEIEQGVEKFSDESLNVMMAEIVEQLKNLNKFDSVALDSEKPKESQTTEGNQTESVKASSESTLRLVGTVTEFKEGSRAARYLIGFGAGKAKVKAHIKIIDSGGAVLLEKDVDGNVVIGVFGGDSKGITRGLAKEIAKVVKKKFF